MIQIHAQLVGFGSKNAAGAKASLTTFASPS